MLSLCPCLYTAFSACVHVHDGFFTYFFMSQSSLGIVGVASLLCRYFRGRGLKGLGTPGLEAKMHFIQVKQRRFEVAKCQEYRRLEQY